MVSRGKLLCANLEQEGAQCGMITNVRTLYLRNQYGYMA
jgi:hypothetical protein